MQRFETVIGLEVHIELNTNSKIFCSCPTTFGAEPNTRVCPVCMGMPGAMPTLNRRVVEYAVRAGLALGSEVSRRSKLDRKNYFYPDLPKAYQITQSDSPLCTGGSVEIETENGRKRVGVTRLHIEEDAGKLTHTPDGTLIDYNRCGVPLIEIVSEPDLRSAEEAVAYLKKLRSIMRAIGVSDCRMSEGSLRCDINLSVHRIGEPFGERTEIKNLSGFRSVARAIEYESARQCELVLRGESVVRETRRFDENAGRTHLLRRKESVGDYRFFPEPNITSFEVTDDEVARIAASLPELPDARKRRYIAAFSLAPYDAEQIADEPAVARWFESAAALTEHPRRLAALTLTELFRILPSDPEVIPISPESAAKLINMTASGKINSTVAKRVFERCCESGGDPEDIVFSENLGQISDPAALERITREALAAEPKLLADYRRGKLAARDAMFGRVMRRTDGRADPRLVAETLDRILAEG